MGGVDTKGGRGVAMNPSETETQTNPSRPPSPAAVAPALGSPKRSLPPPPPKLPSAGFVLIVLVHCAAAALLIWGFSTPRLDRVWTLHHQLKIGDVSKLKDDERQLLERTLVDHSTLAKALISRGDIGVISANRDGWIETPFVTLVRTGDARTREILLNVETSPEHLPFKVEFEGKGWQRVLEVDERKEYRLELPPSSGVAEVIVANVKGKRFKNDPSILGIQVHFPGEELWQEDDEDNDDDAEGGQ